MKAQILKIAGVKTEAEFYKKFPSEEAFMKKHGKELKKAQTGAWIPGVGFGSDVKGMSQIIKKNNQNTGLGMLANSAGSVVGLSQSLADKYGKKDKQLDQYAEIAALAKKAAASAPQPPKQKYVRPEDQMVQPINPLGVQGFGYFEDGGEIQNTFAPNDIYTDMGYEPLNDSNPKQYADGGIMAALNNPANSSQFASAAGSLGGGLGSLVGGDDFQQTEEGSLLSTIGGAAGTVFGGPIGGLIGSAAGGLIGGIVGGNKAKEQKAKMLKFKNDVASIGGTANIQNMNQGSAYVRNGGHIASYENGGYMNPEYNPQVIAKFGDYDINQLFAPPHDADMLRAGGHLKEYTPPSAAAMYTGRDLPYQMENGGQMAMGGDLKVLDGGYAETISYNPFMPGTGETVMFRGRSHDNGGIPVEYGQNGVEVEGGEPMFQMQDGGQMANPAESNTSGVVAGNMVVDKFAAEQIGDLKAQGRKYKHIVADYAKIESKQNKITDSGISMIENADTNDPFDKLSLNTGQAKLIGANMKLKDIADKKKNLAAVQNAILDTAKEHGLESDALAKGKIKYAKANDPYAEFGAKLEQFVDGGKKGKKKKAEPAGSIQSEDIVIENPNVRRKPVVIPNTSKYLPNDFAGENDYVPTLQDPKQQDTAGQFRITDFPPIVKQSGSQSSTKPASKFNFPWDGAARFANSIAPFVVPSNQMDLEAAQLAPEIAALSDNVLEPVYAQTYQPNYTQPVSISYQDQMNANQSDFNALQRQFGYNPEMMAALAGQKYGANSKVLGEQFRANQAEQQRARETNRETANDAQMKNMAIFADQADKMAKTKSILKQQKQVALNSIASKIQQNKLENRQLGIAENLYKFRYTPNGVAYNVNGLANFAPYGSGQASGEAMNIPSGYEADDYTKTPDGKFIPKTLKLKKTSKSESTVSRNGSIVKAIKNL